MPRIAQISQMARTRKKEPETKNAEETSADYADGSNSDRSLCFSLRLRCRSVLHDDLTDGVGGLLTANR